MFRHYIETKFFGRNRGDLRLNNYKKKINKNTFPKKKTKETRKVKKSNSIQQIYSSASCLRVSNFLKSIRKCHVKNYLFFFK